MHCITQHFTAQGGTYRKTQRCKVTADSESLHIAMDCGRGSLIKICALMQIKISRSAHLCWPTWYQWNWHRERHCQPHPAPVLPATHKALPCCCCCWRCPWFCLRQRSFVKWKVKLSINVGLIARLLFLIIIFITLYWTSDSYWSAPTVVSVGDRWTSTLPTQWHCQAAALYNRLRAQRVLVTLTVWLQPLERRKPDATD